MRSLSRPFVDEEGFPFSEDQLAKKKQIAENHEVIPSYLVSKDMKSAHGFR